MASQTRQRTTDAVPQGGLADVLGELPLDRLRSEAVDLGKALAHRGLLRLGSGLQNVPGKVAGTVTGLAANAPSATDVVSAARHAGSPVAEAPKKVAGKVSGAVKGNVMGGGSDKKQKDKKDEGGKSQANGDGTDLKVTNIVETVDVPVNREVAYDLWTQFETFPTFMKKVESVKQREDEVVTWRAQVFLSHRTWSATIVDQVRPEHIVWKSEADKGRVDGAVTFHELAPDLTRVLVTLEYHPQGIFERTGNLWHAQGRRVRLELKHFRRYVANHALLRQDDVEGWEGEIHRGKVKPQKKAQKKVSASRKSTAGSTTSSSSSASRKSAAASRPSSRKSAAKKSAAPSSAKKRTPRKATANRSTGSASSSRTRSTR